MAEAETMRKEEKKKGGGILPAVCNILGTLILFSVILLCIPVTLPKLFGYQIYDVVSGSMEPEIPVGSVIYVKAAEPDMVETGDIIAFQKDGSVITHRVEENRYVEGEFVTKGDANREEDMEPVPYESLIGKVERHIPVLGIIMTLLASNTGKLYAVLLAVCGVMFHMLAGILRDRERD